MHVVFNTFIEGVGPQTSFVSEMLQNSNFFKSFISLCSWNKHVHEFKSPREKKKRRTVLLL